MKTKVLLLGGSGLIAPNLMAGLDPYYDVTLADVKPHPDGREILTVDISDYEQVREAATGMDALMNWTVVRDDPDLSFHVNTRGALNVMKAAAEHGITKVVHSGPQYVRYYYDHDFDVTDVPRATGVGYYVLTKTLSGEICAAYARAHQIHTACFLFNGLAAAPTEPRRGDYPPFTVVWEDLHLAVRLALEIEAIPDLYQEFNMTSYEGHGKYNSDKARRILGWERTGDWERFYRREP